MMNGNEHKKLTTNYIDNEQFFAIKPTFFELVGLKHRVQVRSYWLLVRCSKGKSFDDGTCGCCHNLFDLHSSLFLWQKNF